MAALSSTKKPKRFNAINPNDFLEELEPRLLLAVAAPSGLVASTTSSTVIDLTWKDNSNNETGFTINESLNGTNFSVFLTDANATSYSADGLRPNTRYWFYVTAYNKSQRLANSNTVIATTFATTFVTPPAAPTGLSVLTASTTSINLTWADKSTNESGFNINESTDGVNFTQIYTTAANATSYSVGGLASNTQYWFNVSAFNAGGASKSNTDGDTTLPDASSASLDPQSHKYQVILTSTAGAANYAIQRRIAGDSTWTTISTLGAANLTWDAFGHSMWTDSGLSESTVYWYKVVAADSHGTVLNSSVAAIKTAGFVLINGMNYNFTSTDYANDPVLAGLTRAPSNASHYLIIDRWMITNTGTTGVDDAAVIQVAQNAIKYAAADKVTYDIYLDIEGAFPLDIRRSAAADVAKTVSEYVDILNDIHTTWASAGYSGKVGVYGLVPWFMTNQLWGPQSPDNPADISAWQNADEQLLPIIRQVDFMAPSLYTLPSSSTLTSVSPTPSDWLTVMRLQLAEENRLADLAGGKPLYAFMNMDYIGPQYDTNAVTGRLPLAMWKAELDLVRSQEDGAILWYGWNRPAPAWNGGAANTSPADTQWWDYTRSSYVAGPGALPTAPTDFAVTGSGAHLTWTPPTSWSTSQVTSIIIERSKDGGPFVAVFGDSVPASGVWSQGSWSDSGEKLGSSYTYRLVAVSRAGQAATAPTRAVTLTSRDAFAWTDAVTADYVPSQNVAEDRAVWGLSGGLAYAKYSGVNFGTGATQFRVNVASKDGSGGAVTVLLDAQTAADGSLIAGTGTRVATLTLQGTDPTLWSIFEDHTVQLAQTVTGVHAVYLLSTGAVTRWEFAAGAMALPASPERLSAVATNASTVQLTWSNYAADATSLVIQRARYDPNAPTMAWTDLATINDPSVKSYTDTTINGAVQGYYYRVVAATGAVRSQASNTTSVAIQTAAVGTIPLFVTDPNAIVQVSIDGNGFVQATRYDATNGYWVFDVPQSYWLGQGYHDLTIRVGGVVTTMAQALCVA